MFGSALWYRDRIGTFQSCRCYRIANIYCLEYPSAFFFFIKGIPEAGPSSNWYLKRLRWRPNLHVKIARSRCSRFKSVSDPLSRCLYVSSISVTTTIFHISDCLFAPLNSGKHYLSLQSGKSLRLEAVLIVIAGPGRIIVRIVRVILL